MHRLMLMAGRRAVAASEEGDGFPDASNTGVPDGTSLTTITAGNAVANGLGIEDVDVYKTTANDQIVDSLSIVGVLMVLHARVTVRKCRVAGNGGSGNFVVVYVLSNDCVVEDCTITNGIGGGSGVWLEAVTGGTVQRCDISDTEDGVVLSGSGHTIQENYIHDLLDYPGHAEPAHHDGIQSDSTDCLINHNAVRAKTHTFMSSSMTNGPSSNMTISNNLFQGGAYVLRAEIAGSSGYVVINNRLEFGIGTSGYLDLTGTNGTTPALVISGNVDNLTDAAINWP